jgi:hypothetical protein
MRKEGKSQQKFKLENSPSNHDFRSIFSTITASKTHRMNISKTINPLKIKPKQPFNPIQTMHNKFIFFLTIPKILLTYKKTFSMKIIFLITVLTIKQI